MSDFPLPQLKAYLPTTFAERGVLVPFTTPLLAGARARSGQAGPEVMVPKPSGGAGMYVFQRRGVTQLCRTTVHDRRLLQRLEKVDTIAPRSVREVARAVALEGLAGRHAQSAAEAAIQFDRRAQEIASGSLMLALYEQLRPDAVEEIRRLAATPAFCDQAQQAVVAHAAQLGFAPQTLPLHLQQAGKVFAQVGPYRSEHRTRILNLLETLTRMHEELTAWSKGQPAGSGELGSMVAEVAGATLTCALTATREARLATRDVAALLQQWPANHAMVAAQAERPEWLLDGWEQICQLWRTAEIDAERAAALNEIAALVPVLPKETGEWAHTTIRVQSLFTYRETVLVRQDWRVTSESPARPQGRRRVQRNEDWRTTSLVDFVARNEDLRALSA
ncbi:MAG TPA: hypothetical protein VMB34_01755 [Acetobacteraceae bacterium]|nr:hypothetical protein [Acetobacteraceae bacterium]